MSHLSASHLFDCLILGAGPAGLAAALALSRVNLTAVVFSTSTFRNASASHAHTILTRDHTPPSDIREYGRKDIERYQSVRFIERGIVAVHKAGAVFEATDDQGQQWSGKKVLLATGSKDVFPKIEGYAENWGSNIYQCLFCDGYERRSKAAAVLGFPSPMYLHFASTMLQLGCPEVAILGNGRINTNDEAITQALKVAKAQGVVVDERKIARLINVGGEEGVDVIFEDGDRKRFGFLADKPLTTVVARDIADQLGVEIFIAPSGDELMRRNEPFGESNIKGVFVAGDVGAPMKSVVAAIFSGTTCGAGVNFMLGKDKEERIAEGLERVQ